MGRSFVRGSTALKLTVLFTQHALWTETKHAVWKKKEFLKRMWKSTDKKNWCGACIFFVFFLTILFCFRLFEMPFCWRCDSDGPKCFRLRGVASTPTAERGVALHCPLFFVLQDMMKALGFADKHLRQQHTKVWATVSGWSWSNATPSLSYTFTFHSFLDAFSSVEWLSS